MPFVLDYAFQILEMQVKLCEKGRSFLCVLVFCFWASCLSLYLNSQSFLPFAPGNLSKQGVFSNFLRYRILFNVNFAINLTQVRVVIGSFSSHTRLFDWKLTFSMYQHCPNPFSIKQRRKSIDLSPKSFFGLPTTFRYTFPSSDLQCLPPGDPRVLCA